VVIQEGRLATRSGAALGVTDLFVASREIAIQLDALFVF
jgi:hypothetical protein